MHHNIYLQAVVPGVAQRNSMQYVLKYFLDDKLENVGLIVLYELPILGIAKCTWTRIKILHLLRMPNMLTWRLLVLHVDPQPKPVCSVVSADLEAACLPFDPQAEHVSAVVSSDV